MFPTELQGALSIKLFMLLARLSLEHLDLGQNTKENKSWRSHHLGLLYERKGEVVVTSHRRMKVSGMLRS